MQLRLRTKLTLIMTAMVFLVVAVLSTAFVALVIDQVLTDLSQRTTELAQQVFNQAFRALGDAGAQGLAPATSDKQEMHDYVRHAFEMSKGLQSQLDSSIKSVPYLYEVSIADSDGMVLVSSDHNAP